MDVNTGNNFFLPTLHQWDGEFFIDRPTCPEDENTPYVDVLQRMTDPVSDEEDVIDLFMTGADTHQTERIKEFCYSSKTRNLSKAPTFECGQRADRIAFLRDSDRNGGHQAHFKCLTSEELLRALSQPRFSIDTKSPTDKEAKLTTQRPDAEQRYIYIRDLDSSSVYALAATASKSQSAVLQGFIYDYLMSNAHIGVNISSEGFRKFAIQFHLPFYVFRRSPVPRIDPRGLRQATDVSFLFQFDQGEKTYIYESKVSCAISGFDEYQWVAYLFTDHYYEKLNPLAPVESEGHEDIIGDPLTANRENFCQAVNKPREYFLKVLQARILKIKEEWSTLIYEMERAINKRLHFDSTLGYVDSHYRSDSYEELDKWVSRTSVLTCTLIRTLDKLIGAWRTFSSGGVNYFHQNNAVWSVEERSRKDLVAIAGDFGELSSLAERLKFIVENLEAMKRANFQRRADISMVTQQRDWIEIKILWVIIFVCVATLARTFIDVIECFIPLSLIPILFDILLLSVVVHPLVVVGLFQRGGHFNIHVEFCKPSLQKATQRRDIGGVEQSLPKGYPEIHTENTRFDLGSSSAWKAYPYDFNLEQAIAPLDNQSEKSLSANEDQQDSVGGSFEFSHTPPRRSLSSLLSWDVSDDEEDDDGVVIEHPELKHNLTTLMERIWAVFQERNEYSLGGNIQDASDNHAQPSHTYQGSAIATPPTTIARLRRRQRQSKQKRSDHDDDHDDDDIQSRPNPKKPPSTGSEDLDWACPYSKFKPIKYEECYQYQLKDINRVKQHLTRKHKLPLYCPICYEEFLNEPIRDQHITRLRCQRQAGRSQIEGLTSEQQDWLRQRTGTTRSKEEHWYDIFHYLFPGVDKPCSPYVDRKISRLILQLQDLVATEGPGMIDDSIQDTRDQFPDIPALRADECQIYLSWICRRLIQRLIRTHARIYIAQEGSNTAISSAASGPTVEQTATQEHTGNIRDAIRPAVPIQSTANAHTNANDYVELGSLSDSLFNAGNSVTMDELPVQGLTGDFANNQTSGNFSNEPYCEDLDFNMDFNGAGDYTNG
ncbi:hypothetical protein F5Y19DRAFT_418791 [Xylariaceae sp. FL1651]|nr:hypothetical protein F5Y19DRAFT_418791 [Xylariaceae sp. FL1651]